MTQIISIKPNIIIPNKENADYAKLVKDAHEYVDEVNWVGMIILGKDRDGFVNRWWSNTNYEEAIYLIERTKYHMMQEIDEVNE